MSRIGKLPIHIPQGVTIVVSPDNTVTVKGPKGQLSQKISLDLTVTVEENEVHVQRHTEDKEHKAQHGLYRALIHNMVVGVSEGYTIKQELVGVGFRANAEGQVLELGLGYS
ncbi:MAG: 50S ribosomal protein L6, partial [Odoribacter sp.]|nr:50S ribosomal protein L6 [Odoribacter sp.]